MSKSPPASYRAVIDTSSALPALTGPNSEEHPLVHLWQSYRIIPLVNAQTLAELNDEIIAKSPTPKLLQAQRYRDRTLRRYSPWYEELPVATLPDSPKCREPKDQVFVNLAIYGEAHLLIARDPDLLVMKPQLAKLSPPILVADDRYDLTNLVNAPPAAPPAHGLPNPLHAAPK